MTSSPASRVAFLVLGAFLLASAAATHPARSAPAVFINPALPDAGKVGKRTRKKAARAYEKAKRYYAADRYAKALEAAERAFSLLPTAGTALVKATILVQLSRNMEAAEMLLLALRLDPSPVERSLIESAFQRVATALDPPIGWVEVRGEPRGAWVSIAGRTLAAPCIVGLPVGTWEVRVLDAERQPATFESRVEKGLGAVVRYRLRAREAPAPKPATPKPATTEPAPKSAAVSPWGPAREEAAHPAPGAATTLPASPAGDLHAEVTSGPRPIEVAALSLLAGGGLFLGAGLGSTAWASDAMDRAATYARPSADLDDDERSADYRAARRDLLTAEALEAAFYTAAILSTAAGFALILLDDEGSDRKGPALTPTATAAGAGVALYGRF